jgi:hypothetical protein
MDQILNLNGYPCFEAVAPTGEGVLDTLTKITKMVLQHIEMGTSGKQQRSTTAAMPEKTFTTPDISQPATVLKSSDPVPAKHVEVPQENYAPASYKPAQTKPSYEIDQGYSLPEEKKPDVAPSDIAAHQEKRSFGNRIQIVGTENAEIISANAVQLPIRVKFEGDTRIYRMDLAIKLDGFKSEE